MTQPQREIVGKFTENFEYTVNGEPDILRSTQWHD